MTERDVHIAARDPAGMTARDIPAIERAAGTGEQM